MKHSNLKKSFFDKENQGGNFWNGRVKASKNPCVTKNT